MFNYEINAAEIRSIIKDVFFHQCKPLILLLCFVFPFSVYVVICGVYFSDEDVLRTMGYPTLAFAVLLAFFIIVFYFSLRKRILDSFEMGSINGIVEYRLNLSEGHYEVTNMTMKKKIIIQKNDTKKRLFLKRIVLIKLVSGLYMAFPRTKETEALFMWP